MKPRRRQGRRDASTSADTESTTKPGISSGEYGRLFLLCEELATLVHDSGSRVAWLWRLHVRGRRLLELTRSLIRRLDRRQTDGDPNEAP
jgi:hypothetical protein